MLFSCEKLLMVNFGNICFQVQVTYPLNWSYMQDLIKVDCPFLKFHIPMTYNSLLKEGTGVIVGGGVQAVYRFKCKRMTHKNVEHNLAICFYSNDIANIKFNLKAI